MSEGDEAARSNGFAIEPFDPAQHEAIVQGAGCTGDDQASGAQEVSG